MLMDSICLLTVTGSRFTDAVNPAALLPLPDVYICNAFIFCTMSEEEHKSCYDNLRTIYLSCIHNWKVI